MGNSEELYTKKQGEPPRKAFAIWLSRLYLLAAAALAVYTCSVCIPSVREHLASAEDSRAVQAFSSMAQSLREGDGVAEAFSASYRVLSGAAD